MSSEKVSKTILYCGVLHDIAKYCNDDFNLEKNVCEEVIDEDEVDNEGNRLRRRGVRKATILLRTCT